MKTWHLGLSLSFSVYCPIMGVCVNLHLLQDENSMMWAMSEALIYGYNSM